MTVPDSDAAVFTPEGRVPRGEIEARIGTFQRRLADAGFDGALIVQAADLYYLAGTAQDAHLLVPASGEPALFVRRSVERARFESPLERVVAFASLSALPRLLEDIGVASGVLGLELDVLPASRYLGYRRLLPAYDFADCSPLLRSQRAIKSKWEQAQIRDAAEMAAAAAAAVPTFLVEGMTELELAAELERVLRRRGHQGPLRFRGFNQDTFYGVIAAGESAAAAGASDAPITGLGASISAPKGASARQIRAHTPVIVDLYGTWNGYIADQTRVFSIGRLADHFRDTYELAYDIEREIAQALRPGVTCGSIFDRAAAIGGGHSGFMGGAEQGISFVGHGVGLEIDELPILARSSEMILEEGMVVAVEPKFVFPGDGAVGIEDTYVVEGSGGVAVTTAPTELMEL